MKIAYRAFAVFGLLACAACTVNTPPAQPNPVVVQQPPAVTTVPGAVVVRP